MSKNKNYHNYKNYSNNKPQTEEVTPEVAEVQEKVTVEVEEETTPVQEEVAPAPTSEPQSVKPTIGVVTNCPRLRVRAAASTNAEVLCEIAVDSEVIIDEQKSTKDFYKVRTGSVEGFCMKKFITVK